jgi:hypothetical protein
MKNVTVIENLSVDAELVFLFLPLLRLFTLRCSLHSQKIAVNNVHCGPSIPSAFDKFENTPP